MTKIDYKAIYQQTATLLKLCRNGNDLLTMEKDEALRKYMDAEKELSGIRKKMASLREDCPNHPTTRWECGPVALVLCSGVLIALIFWFVLAFQAAKEPIIQRESYPVYITRGCGQEGVWEDRCRRALEVLAPPSHHSGRNNGRAFAILNGG
jgi:hypothetical protein